MPAVFTWPSVWPRTDPPWDPALVYPPAGIAEPWAPERSGDEALESLLGRRRARVLLELDRPSCTLELAGRMEASPGGVSDHLTVLRQAGLVTRRRERGGESSKPEPRREAPYADRDANPQVGV